MEKDDYVKPELEELGQLRDVTGGIFDIVGDILGGGRGRGTPPRRGSH